MHTDFFKKIIAISIQTAGFEHTTLTSSLNTLPLTIEGCCVLWVISPILQSSQMETEPISELTRSINEKLLVRRSQTEKP